MRQSRPKVSRCEGKIVNVARIFAHFVCLSTLKNHFHFLVPRRRKNLFSFFSSPRLPDCQGRDFLFQTRGYEEIHQSADVETFSFLVEKARKTFSRELQKLATIFRVGVKDRAEIFHVSLGVFRFESLFDFAVYLKLNCNLLASTADKFFPFIVNDDLPKRREFESQTRASLLFTT